ncbi:MAG: transcription termination factor Rho [Actinomycetaceae bacterium]|nr:transcription termination factor Rho [Actinomycetaceae bacterium]MDY5272939.1 transcription termination factor Rho [Arcanobacterium sp.]
MSDKPLSVSALNAMRVADIKTLAAQMGIDLGPKARKTDYIDAIKASGAPFVTRKRRSRAAAEQPAAAAEPTAVRQAEAEQPQLDDAEKAAALEAIGEAAQRKAQGRRNRRHDAASAVNELTHGRAREADAEQTDSDESESGERTDRRERRTAGNRRERTERTDRRERHNGMGTDNAETVHTDVETDDRSHENEDVLLPVAGILDISGTNSYLRTGGYLPGKSDAYVSSQIIKKYGLRRGDAIVGAVRSLADSPNRRGQRQHKYNPLVEITAINGLSPEESLQRPDFNKLTPLYPQEMLRVETTKNALTTRVIDLVAPIGKGQRGLIVSPPKAGKTVIMQQLAMAIAKNNPEVHLMVVLVDERPEEVTDMQRLVRGEVIASTFDRPASDHTTVSELAVERAKRLVELGQDVVILLDSLTRLSRAYNLAVPASGRILTGGVDAAALYPPKKFFGAARNIENGGSLTIIASALVETGSKMDEVIFEEFKGTGNMELRLSRQLADRRIFPAVDVNASGTRREELLFSPEELKIVWHLRRALGTLDVQEASDYLLGRLRKTDANKDFLVSVVRGMQSVE